MPSSGRLPLESVHGQRGSSFVFGARGNETVKLWRPNGCHCIFCASIANRLHSLGNNENMLLNRVWWSLQHPPRLANNLLSIQFSLLCTRMTRSRSTKASLFSNCQCRQWAYRPGKTVSWRANQTATAAFVNVADTAESTFSSSLTHSQ